MKYRDENGDFQDLYFKTGDTLPIGTEVDYDGENIPAGWEEVSGSPTTIKIRKKEDAAGVVGNVTNTRSDSTKDTYSCDYINDTIDTISGAGDTLYSGNITAIGDYDFLSESDNYRFIVIAISTGTSSNRGYCVIPGPRIAADSSQWVFVKVGTIELNARIAIKSTYLSVLSIESPASIRSVVGIL